MADPFLGEIRAFGFNFAPVNWAVCNGATMAVQQNTALFALLGVKFGGNGTTQFKLPNLSGNVAMGSGNGPGLTPEVIGATIGQAAVTLTVPSIANHDHQVNGRGTTTPTSQTAGPTATSLLSRAFTLSTSPTSTQMYSGVDSVNTNLSPAAITPSGSNTPHENRQPFLTLNYCIALAGEFPPRP